MIKFMTFNWIGYSATIRVIDFFVFTSFSAAKKNHSFKNQQNEIKRLMAHSKFQYAT